jgi:hypothetical protein
VPLLRLLPRISLFSRQPKQPFGLQRLGFPEAIAAKDRSSVASSIRNKCLATDHSHWRRASAARRLSESASGVGAAAFFPSTCHQAVESTAGATAAAAFARAKEPSREGEENLATRGKKKSEAISLSRCTFQSAKPSRHDEDD